MSVLDKIMFWKRGDDFSDLGVGTDPLAPPGEEHIDVNRDFGLGQAGGFDSHDVSPPGAQQRGFSPSPQFSQQSYNAPQQMGQPVALVQQNNDIILQKNMEVISSKLDALRASLDNISARLSNLERLAYGEQEQKPRYPRW